MAQGKRQNIFRGLLGSPYLGLITVDKDSLITEMNQTFAESLGLERDQAIGRPVLEVVPHSRLPEILQTGRIDKADIWSIGGNDTVVTRLPLIQDGEIVGAIGLTLYLDRSGARVLMQMLQDTEAEFKAYSEALLESPYMVYVAVNREGIVTLMNQTYLEALGLTREEAIGQHITQVITDTHLPEILRTGKVEEADLIKVGEHDAIVTSVPIIKDGEIIGAVAKSLFLDMAGAKMLIGKLQETEKELEIYKEEVRQGYRARWEFKDLIGHSGAFMEVKAMASQMANTATTLLITGESGTGKEYFAHAIHNASSRRKNPFVRINCAALPEHLLESELFGYEEGAFTGAAKGGKPGKFELAMGGTILLDEIGDMPLAMQTKLLSVLQERMIERVGGTKPIYINVRVIAATNRDLESMVEDGRFRQDLYYRLNVVALHIPPLRERTEDIPELVKTTMNKINAATGTHVQGISDGVIELMQNYSWPGNVRELENLVERAINLAYMNGEDTLSAKHFPTLVAKVSLPAEESGGHPATMNEAIELMERKMIVEALARTNGNKLQAAKQLGLYTPTLYRKLEKYGLH